MVSWNSFEILSSPVEDYMAAQVQVQAGRGEAVPSFQLGFKDLADRLGAAVVGDPEVDEKTLHNPDGSNVLTVQKTTAGVMFYMAGGQPIFLPGKA